MRINIFLIFSLTLQQISFGQDSTKFRLLTFGLPNFEREDAKKIIAKKWSIDFYAVEDCIVDQDLIDSTERENKIQNEKITAFYGQDWRNKFEKEVDDEFIVHQKISKLIDKQKFIKNKRAELKKLDEPLFYKVKSTNLKNVYEVIVDSYGKWQGKDEFIIYYILEVDYNRKFVKILSDKPKLE